MEIKSQVRTECQCLISVHVSVYVCVRISACMCVSGHISVCLYLRESIIVSLSA